MPVSDGWRLRGEDGLVARVVGGRILEEGEEVDVVAAPAGRPETTISLPYSPQNWALLRAAFPLTEEEWNHLMDTLGAMRPGLVGETGESTDASE